MRPGRLNRYVTLSKATRTSPDSDGFFEALSPAAVWASIDSLPPGSADDGDRTVGHVVTMRYHSGVTVDTRIVYGTRELFVKGVQNVNDANAELRLYCEEVQA